VEKGRRDAIRWAEEEKAVSSQGKGPIVQVEGGVGFVQLGGELIKDA
jgi:hypothetical protein